MKFSKAQQSAISRVVSFAEEHDAPLFRLFGSAGTGKTAIAKHIAETVDGIVLFAAFTGKAALVLRRAGCVGATTIHRLIYLPREKSAMRLRELEADAIAMPDDAPEIERHELQVAIEAERENMRRPAFTLNLDSPIAAAKLVIIDECSMIDDQMATDLLSFGVPILVLGDPYQLPPVRGTGYFVGEKPDVLLTEVFRQAEGSPILDLADLVREGRPLTYGRYGDSSVIPYGTLQPEEVLAADQIIVGRNATRRASNRRMRELLGRRESLIEVGEKLVCLRNDHEEGLLNGGIWRVTGVDGISDDEAVFSAVDDTDDSRISVVAHTAPFLGDPVNHWIRRDAQEFDYGYALTCHKSQGSQWDNVIVFDESAAFKADSAKWLYTAITRASKRVTVVM